MPTAKRPAKPAPHPFESDQLVKLAQDWKCLDCGGEHGQPHPTRGARVFLRVITREDARVGVCQVCVPPEPATVRPPWGPGALFFGLDESELPEDR